MKDINLTYIMKCLFSERSKFQNLSDSEKTKWGFIVNRMLSKKYPEYAQKLNVRMGDFCMVMNLWWLYLKTRRDDNYHSWVWVTGSKKSKIDRKTIDLILERFPFLSTEDIEYLYDNHKDVFNEEIKYYKKLKEDYGLSSFKKGISNLFKGVENSVSKLSKKVENMINSYEDKSKDDEEFRKDSMKYLKSINDRLRRLENKINSISKNINKL